jgi:phage virion morphogenesis protein
VLKIDTSQLREAVQRLTTNAQGISTSLGPVKKIISLLGIRAIQRNFRNQKNADGTPWPRLKYRVGTPLVDKLGRMPKGISSDTSVNRVVIIGAGYATRAYNAIHNFGGDAGRGHKTHIPQRQYMFFSPEDVQSMVSEVQAFVTRRLQGA